MRRFREHAQRPTRSGRSLIPRGRRTRPFRPGVQRMCRKWRPCVEGAPPASVPAARHPMGTQSRTQALRCTCRPANGPGEWALWTDDGRTVTNRRSPLRASATAQAAYASSADPMTRHAQVVPFVLRSSESASLRRVTNARTGQSSPDALHACATTAPAAGGASTAAHAPLPSRTRTRTALSTAMERTAHCGVLQLASRLAKTPLMQVRALEEPPLWPGQQW
jgi:hypothetical protein